MRKVLYVTQSSKTINKYLVAQIEMLKKYGYRVDCACLVEDQINKKLTAKGLRVFNIPFSKRVFGIGNISAFFRLADIQRINNYEIIHVHEEVAAVYTRLLKFKYPKAKIIYSTEKYNFNNKISSSSYLLHYSIEKLLASLTDIIINTNKEDYEITEAKLRPAKSYIIEGLYTDLSKSEDLSENDITRIEDELLEVYKNIQEEEFFGQSTSLYYTTK